MGIPGDLSSQSRFVKVAFTKLNAISGDGENESVSQFFHILGSVDQQRDAVRYQRAHMRLRSILHAATRQREFIIIPHMIITR